jgi:hypothetical protein
MENSPLTRSRDLRLRASLTNKMPPNNSVRAANTITERREALDLLEEMEAFCVGVMHEHRALSTRVYELASLATRGSNGHTWTADLPQKANATAFYQSLRALIKHLRERSQ